MMFDEKELAKTLKYFGDPQLPERYLAFLRENPAGQRFGSIGYRAFAGPALLETEQMRLWSAGHCWGREFMPFMANHHAFVAFDLRRQDVDVDPPIVFLDWDDEEDGEIRYDKVQWLSDDLEGFLGLLGLWQRPDELPQFKRCSDPGPFEEVGLVFEPLAFPMVGAGDVLRSGRFGVEELRVGQKMRCVAECPEAPELVEELTVRLVWNRVRAVVGDRVIPFMTGEDGWLALDYRVVDSEPPVVFIPRSGDLVAGDPRRVADSVIDAYGMFT